MALGVRPCGSTSPEPTRRVAGADGKRDPFVTLMFATGSDTWMEHAREIVWEIRLQEAALRLRQVGRTRDGIRDKAMGRHLPDFREEVHLYRPGSFLGSRSEVGSPGVSWYPRPNRAPFHLSVDYVEVSIVTADVNASGGDHR